MRAVLLAALATVLLAAEPALAAVDVLQPVGGPVVKTAPLVNGQIWGAPFQMHFGAPASNWAGVGFTVTWDPAEVNFIGINPAPGFNGFSAGGGASFALPTLFGPNANASGISVSPSSLLLLGNFVFSALGTTPLNNSDIDIVFGSAFNIFHVPANGPVQLQASDRLYVPQANPVPSAWGPVAQGAGTWIQLSAATTLFGLQSAFFGTTSNIATPGGIGVEHVPAPATLLLLGTGMLGVGLRLWRRASWIA